jgi:large-conductance mechanosensitive channel
MRTGGALAVTVGIGYTACALVFWAWPEAAMTFMNALFHGVDFRKLQVSPKVFEFGSFFYALVGIVVWAFFLGVVYSAVRGGRE